MKDLISREAAIMAAINGADRWDGGSNHGREFFIRENINEVPAVDAVEVVRCYQCKNYLKSPMICEREDGLWTPDKLDYCSFGERWDGE